MSVLSVIAQRCLQVVSDIDINLSTVDALINEYTDTLS